MPTMEEEVAALTTATTDLISTVNVRKAALDTAETNAAASAASAASDAGIVTANITAIDTVSNGISAVTNVSDNISSILANYTVGPIEPTNPGDGMQWFDTFTREYKIWDGGTWNVFKITSFSPDIAYSFGRKTVITLAEDDLETELFTNELFDNGLTSWLTVGDTTELNGVVTLDSTIDTAMLYQGVLESGITAKVVLDIQTLSGSVDIIDNDGITLATIIDGVNEYYISHNSASNNILLRARLGGIVSTAKFSLKKVVRYRGDRYLQNVGTDGSTNDIDLYGSNHLKLDSALNEALPVKIAHTLGVELKTSEVYGANNDGDSVLVNTPIVNGQNVTFTANTGGLNNFYVNISDDTLKNLKVEFTALINSSSGNMIIDSIYDGTTKIYLDTPHTIVNGINTIEVSDARVGSGNVLLYLSPETKTNDFNIDFTFASVKQIITANSFLTYFDVATKKIETLGNSVDGGSSKEIAIDKEFDDTTAIYPTSSASYTVSGSKLLGVGTATIPANQTIRVLDYDDLAGKLEVGKWYLFHDNVTRATSSTVGYNTAGFEFPNGNAWYYHSTILGEHKVIAQCTSASATVSLHISTAVDAETDWDFFSLSEVVPVSQTYNQDKDSSNIFATTVPVTQADRDYITNVNPEAVAQLWAGETVPELSFVKTDLYSYYPCNEIIDTRESTSRKFAHNVMGTSTDVMVISSMDNTHPADAGSTLTPITNGYRLEAAIGIQAVLRPVGAYGATTGNVGKLAVFEADIIVNSGSTDFIHLYDGLQQTVADYPITTGKWKHYYQVGGSNTPELSFGIAAAYSIDILNLTWKYVDAAEIENYTDLCKTTYEDTNYGMSKYLLKEDLNTGRMIGVVDEYTVGLTGRDTRLDTKWKPAIDEAYSFELVWDLVKKGAGDITEAIGVLNARLRNYSNGYLYFYNNLKWVYANTWASGLNHIIITRTIEGDLRMYLNGIESGTVGLYSSAGISTSTFTLDSVEVAAGTFSEKLTSNIGMFKKYPNKVLTQQEVTSAYNAAKILYPTLP